MEADEHKNQTIIEKTKLVKEDFDQINEFKKDFKKFVKSTEVKF